MKMAKKDPEVEEKEAQAIEEKCMTISTASRTNFDPTAIAQPICYDNIFAKERFENHPRYQKTYPDQLQQAQVPDLEDLDYIFNPEEDQHVQAPEILLQQNQNEIPLKESSIRISKKVVKTKSILKKDDEMVFTVADVKTYLNERRTKAKTGIREDHETYISQSQQILNEDEVFLNKVCQNKGRSWTTDDPELKKLVDELKTKRKSLKKRVMKHMKQNGQGGLLKVRDHQFDMFI